MKLAESNSLKNRRSRLEHPLSESLNKRLGSYAAAASAAGVGSRTTAADAAKFLIRWAASAAGVGMVLTAGPVSARIVYTPAYKSVPLSYANFPSSVGLLPLDLNHDGINDFLLRNRLNYVSSAVVLDVRPALAGNAILGIKQKSPPPCSSTSSRYLASALPAGHRIGPGSAFGRYSTMLLERFGSCYQTLGQWKRANGKFLGLELTINGQKHFGWARLNVVLQFPIVVTLTGYAYETVPGKAIRAGQRGPVVGDSIVPELHSAPPATAALHPATLGLLALGSSGLDIWRREADA